MRVIELDKFDMERCADMAAGSYYWYLQHLHFATGFFEYDVPGDAWYVTEKVKPLLSVWDKKGVASLLEYQSLDGIVAEFLQNPQMELVSELSLCHKDIPWETFLIRGERTVDTSGRPKVRGMVFDVSKKMIDDGMNSQLQKLQSLGQLTSGISHDFNNQLNGILGYVALMKNSVEDAKIMQYLDGIDRSVKYATSLTRQLLSFAHKAVSDDTIVDLPQIIEDTHTMLRHTVDKRIKIDIEMEENDFRVAGNSSKIYNAILNLCLNARDAIKNHGKIRVTLKKEFKNMIPNNLLGTTILPGQYAVITVTDSGIGMDESLLRKALNPFFTTKNVGKGTGMGLPQVQETVKEHNGAMTIESRLGYGTTFTIYLPHIQGVEIMECPEMETMHSGKILLIDDEPSNLEITSSLLEGYGYSVKSFSNPMAAVSHFSQFRENYDCILLDVIMPDMSGIEVFKAVRAIDPAINIILLTGVTDPFELDFSLRQGGDAYLAKPIDHNQLSRTVYNVINTHTLSPKTIKAEDLVQKITSLNVRQSLDRIAGNTGLYLKIALNFRKEFYTIVEQLPQLIETNRVDAIRKVHTIKGLAGQIGADELAIYAGDLESGLTASGTDAREELQEIFYGEFIDVADELLRLEKAV